MNGNKRLESVKPWWLWKHPAAENALNGAVLATWLPQVRSYLRSHPQHRHNVQTWLQTEVSRLLRRHPWNLRKVATGEHAATDAFLLGLAVLLGKQVGCIRPHLTIEYVARATTLLPATFRLCASRQYSGRIEVPLLSFVEGALLEKQPSAECIPFGQAHAYARFCLACAAKGADGLSRAAVQERASSLDEEEQRLVQGVDRRLAPLVLAMDAALPPR